MTSCCVLFTGGVKPVSPRDYLHQLPFFVITAAAAGVCGVVFNQLSHWLTRHVRPRHGRVGWKLFEVAVVSVGTVVLRFAGEFLLIFICAIRLTACFVCRNCPTHLRVLVANGYLKAEPAAAPLSKCAGG